MFGSLIYYIYICVITKTETDMKKIRLNFSPIIKIENTLFRDVSSIIVNGGGGMGGSREEIFCEEIIIPKDDLGFMVIKEIRTNEVVKINPTYIGTIRKINVTKVYFEHQNSNFPSGKRTEWFTHRVNTKVEFVRNDGYTIPSVEEGGKDETLKLKLIHTDNH